MIHRLLEKYLQTTGALVNHQCTTENSRFDKIDYGRFRQISTVVQVCMYVCVRTQLKYSVFTQKCISLFN